jgi:hypothetical protein
VNSLPDALPLAELQARFAAALRAGAPRSNEAAPGFPSDVALPDEPAAALAECIVDDGLAPATRVQVYRNNLQAMFEDALARTYPVLRRRVGDDYFARLAVEYRQDHPSQSGDLHWVGRRFPEWLGLRTAGSDYAWLADLARLEWACEEALVSNSLPAAAADSLARVPPEGLAGLQFSLQPGLRLVSSAFPVWSVWQANQPASPGDAVDPSLGPQQVVVAPDADGLALRSLPVDQFRFVEELAAGRTLGSALDASGLPVERLAATLAWLFGAGLVTAVTPQGASAPGEGETSTS